MRRRLNFLGAVPVMAALTIATALLFANFATSPASARAIAIGKAPALAAKSLDALHLQTVKRRIIRRGRIVRGRIVRRGRIARSRRVYRHRYVRRSPRIYRHYYARRLPRNYRRYARRYWRRGPVIVFPYYYRGRAYSRCEYWGDRCAENWGYRANDYYGCLRYHGC